LQFATHLTDYLYHVSFRRYGPLKLLLSCEVAQKSGFSPNFWGEEITQILDMCFQIVFTSDRVADFCWVLFSELGDSRTKK